MGISVARTKAVAITVLSALFVALLVTKPLWLTSREFPLLPVADWIPRLNPPWDLLCFFALLGSIALALWRFRLGTVLVALLVLFLFLCDQNREQPWLYLYLLLLACLWFPDQPALTASRLVISATYAWAGIQKLNPVFFKVVPPWFVEPARTLLPGEIANCLQALVAAAPFIEILIAFALWFPRSRKAAILAVFFLHASAIALLGPLGHNHNAAIWPWNLAMIALVILLFPAGDLGWPLRTLRSFRPAMAVSLVVWLLPVLSFFGRCDSYLAFALYSGSASTCDIYITEGMRNRLPLRLQPFTHALTNYNAQIQGPYVLDHQTWSVSELGAPSLPESRGFRSVLRYFARYSADVSDLRAVVVERGVKTVFIQGDMEYLLRIPSGASANAN